MGLTWEAKVIAAVVADTDGDGVAETNWKHEVTPDRGDINIWLDKINLIMLFAKWQGGIFNTQKENCNFMID